MSKEKEIAISRMMQQFEHQISEMNSQEITDRAGDIRKSDFLKLAKVISILRARYLKDVLRMARAGEEQSISQFCVDIRKERLVYEEALESFDQLKHALQRGYFNLVDD